MRKNFFYGREFLGDGDLEAQLRHWLEHTANVRIHRTTLEQPVVRFERDERALPQPLPPRPYQSLVVPAMPRRSGDTQIYAPQVPVLTVERRPLAQYAELVGGGL